MTDDTGNINYPLSTAASLASAWAVLGDESYRVRAGELAHLVERYLTPEGFVWGEGKRGENDFSPRGLRPVDLCYNVCETLPNLALYAHLTGDHEIARIAADSLRTHLSFLLPDGGWDAGWASRMAKWVYWGSRTADGAASGLVLLSNFDPRFADAATVCLDQLAAYTHDGILYGGPHAHDFGLRPCLHHTFVAAKGLASVLDASPIPADRLPEREPVPTVRAWRDIATIAVNVGPWRSSVTASDVTYENSLWHHPGGGSLTMLWHKAVGPVAVASMNNYFPLEPVNMAAPMLGRDMAPLTPRIDLTHDGKLFSTVYEYAPTLDHEQIGDTVRVTAHGSLRNDRGDELSAPVRYRLEYIYDADSFSLSATADQEGATLVCPVVANASEPAVAVPGGFAIMRAAGRVTVTCAAPLSLAPERVYNHTPGFEAAVFTARLQANQAVAVRIAVD
jgi:hypothetical protein